MSIKEKIINSLDVISKEKLDKILYIIEYDNNTDVEDIDVDDPDFLWDTSDKNDPDYYVKISVNEHKRGIEGCTLEESSAEIKQMLIEEGLRQGYTLEEIDKMFKEAAELDDDYEV